MNFSIRVIDEFHRSALYSPSTSGLSEETRRKQSKKDPSSYQDLKFRPTVCKQTVDTTNTYTGNTEGTRGRKNNGICTKDLPAGFLFFPPSLKLSFQYLPR